MRVKLNVRLLLFGVVILYGLSCLGDTPNSWSQNRNNDQVDAVVTDSVSISIEDQIQTQLDKALPKAVTEAASEELSDILIYLYVFSFIMVAISFYTLLALGMLKKQVKVIDRQKRNNQGKVNDLQQQIKVLQTRARPSRIIHDDFLKTSTNEDRRIEIPSRSIRRSGAQSTAKPEMTSKPQFQRVTTPANPVEMYNRVSVEEAKEEEFKRAFDPRRVEVFDLDKNIRFQESVIGNLWCIKHGSEYYLLPKYGTIFTTAVRKGGGGDMIFDCGSYKQGVDYAVARVERPAIVELTEGKYWKLMTPGKIELIGN